MINFLDLGGTHKNKMVKSTTMAKLTFRKESRVIMRNLVSKQKESKTVKPSQSA